MTHSPKQMAEQVKKYGRFGDDVLVHMNRRELGILASAWPMTINPDTGQPEFFLQFLLPLLAEPLVGAIAGTALTGLESALVAGGASALGGILDGKDPAEAIAGGVLSGVTGGVLGGGAAGKAGTGIMNAATPGGVSGAAGFAGTGSTGSGILGGITDNLSSAMSMDKLIPMLAMGSLAGGMFGGNVGPEPKEKKDIPENFPDQYRVANQNINPSVAGMSPEQQYFTQGVNYQYPGGYAEGGAVFGQNLSRLPVHIREMIMRRGGWGGEGGRDRWPSTPRPPTPIQVRDPGSLFAGGAPQVFGGQQLPPTPVAAPSGFSMNFQPTNIGANLRAARPGYAHGGQVQIDDAELVKATIMALQSDDPQAEQIIQMFIKRFGEEALQDLVSKLQGGQQQPQGRMISGPGDGLSDSIPAQVDGQQPSALSSGEFVVPADAVSHLGNGSNEAGSKQLYDMIANLRAARTGKPDAPPPVDPRQVLPA